MNGSFHGSYTMKKTNTMHCLICRNHGGNTPFAKEGSNNFRRTAIADHGSSKQHAESLENSFMKKTLENMREKIKIKGQLKNGILLRVASFIAREDIALDKYESLCSMIEDIINIILPGEQHSHLSRKP